LLTRSRGGSGMGIATCAVMAEASMNPRNPTIGNYP
jgi:hypothetical protein